MSFELELINLQHVVLENKIEATRTAVGRAIDQWRLEVKGMEIIEEGYKEKIRRLQTVLRLDDKIFREFRIEQKTKERRSNGTATS